MHGLKQASLTNVILSNDKVNMPEVMNLELIKSPKTLYF